MRVATVQQGSGRSCGRAADAAERRASGSVRAAQVLGWKTTGRRTVAGGGTAEARRWELAGGEEIRPRVEMSGGGREK